MPLIIPNLGTTAELDGTPSLDKEQSTKLFFLFVYGLLHQWVGSGQHVHVQDIL